eukprot:CAMPEP_0194487776 /NCGR_PEP_ID=MMETSP0253-20130528/7948_1 /TAXON_ID=2966 /ORGANISM="Noctiluca scintillans" /LENGTH=248 /DNA_ID=CAMNT_0039328041 /DNA_START=26 /DNA_END=773 /DNA_ORIENTATION=-
MNLRPLQLASDRETDDHQSKNEAMSTGAIKGMTATDKLRLLPHMSTLLSRRSADPTTGSRDPKKMQAMNLLLLAHDGEHVSIQMCSALLSVTSGVLGTSVEITVPHIWSSVIFGVVRNFLFLSFYSSQPVDPLHLLLLVPRVPAVKHICNNRTRAAEIQMLANRPHDPHRIEHHQSQHKEEHATRRLHHATLPSTIASLPKSVQFVALRLPQQRVPKEEEINQKACCHVREIETEELGVPLANASQGT